MHKIKDIFDLVGFKSEINDNRIVLTGIKYNLTGILSLDIHLLRKKMFHKIYVDLYEFIEYVLKLNVCTKEYNSKVTDIILDASIRTIIKDIKIDEVRKKEIVTFYKDLMRLDIGDTSMKFLIPTGMVDISESYVKFKLICSREDYSRLKVALGKRVEDIVTYDKKITMFELKYDSSIAVEDIAFQLCDSKRSVTVDREFGFGDPSMQVHHLVSTILNMNSDVYRDTLNSASMIKIVDELSLI